MERDEALSILRAAGYAIDHVADDQWQIALATHPHTTTIVHEGMLLALAEAMVRSSQRLGSNLHE